MKHYRQTYHNVRTERDKLYDIWRQMIARCYDENNISYCRYGARGIKVCQRWLVGTSRLKPHRAFYQDMGPRKEDNLSLERIDNDGDYTLENCRWATKKEQTRNTRANVFLTYKGKTQCIVDWARELDINRTTIASRIKAGRPIEQILSKRSLNG